VAIVSSAPLARLNPVTKIALALVLSVALVLTVDLVTAGIVLAAELLALPLAGLGARALLLRAGPLAVLAVSVTVLNALVSDRTGPVFVALGPFVVSEPAAVAGLAAGLRLVAIALPGVVLLATTDPTELADALAQRLRLPHRFVLGALAAFRLLTVLGEEWRSMARARRARGLRTGGSPRAALSSFAGQTFSLLVAAIRRGTRMAVAMEARGLGVRPARSWARTSPFRWGDAVALAGSLIVAVGASGVALTLGTWEFLF
jgi:energy-coupling factor transport system permease protein